MLSGFQEIGEKTGCSFAGTDSSKPTEVAKQVLAWLRQQENWLFVIDNLDDVSVADGFLPTFSEKGGHTLITTRNPNATNIPAEGVEIPVLEENFGIELLLRRSDIKEIDFSFHTDIAQDIVKELGHLALAIDHAAAFIRSLGDITKFLSIYRSSRRRVLQRNSTNKSTYPNSVEVTFLLSFDRLKGMDYGGQAAKLLQLLVFLNPDVILIEFLRAGEGGLRDELREIIADEFIFHESLELLRQFSLIRRSQKKDMLAIHRLVQAVLRDQLSETELHQYCDDVIGICEVAFPEIWDTQQTRELCRSFQSQVVEPAFEAATIFSKNSGRVLQKIGRFLREDGKLKDSERLLRYAYENAVILFGNEHSKTLASMSNLASTYRDQGKLQDASDLEERVLAAWKRTLGEEHPNTLTTMNNLASTYRDQGKLQDASDLQKRVLVARKRTLGEEHPDTLRTMNNLASTYRDQGKLQDASDLEERVLAAWKRTLGEEHPNTLTTMNNLASTYRDQGKLQDASDLQKRVLVARKRTLGEEHPDTLRTMNNLASTYRDQGKLQDALDLEERVLVARKRTLGEEHPDTLTTMNNLASTYWDQGKLQDASDLEERVLVAWKRTLGEEHPNTLTTMNNLASTYWDQGKLQDASDLQKRVLVARKRTLGEEHPNTLTTMNNLASTYWDQGKLQDASDLEERVLVARRRTLGEEHPDTLKTMNNLAWTYESQGQVTKAADLMQRAVEGSERVLGKEHPDTVDRKVKLRCLNDTLIGSEIAT